MADLPTHPATDDDGSAGPGHGGPTTGRPRWVSVAGIVMAILLVLLLAVLHLTGILGPGGH
jgi:hypothetical protein